ncbi:MAG: hypothetical protein ABI354_03460 [Candidatus Saccharimonadales bacterium]
MNRPHLRTLITLLVALIVPVTMLVGVLTAAYFKTTNPNNVDVSQGLAYLQQTIIAGIAAFILLVLIILLGIVKMYKQDQGFRNAKLPLILLTVVSMLMIAVISTNAYTGKVQDKYLIDHGRPTLQQYFDALDKQKLN